MYISKRSGMDHTVLTANTPCLPFLHKRSPDCATPNWGKRHPIAAYYSSIDPEGMEGWVGLVGWRIADGLPTWVVTCPQQVGRRTEKVRRPQTDVLPLSHAANQKSGGRWRNDEALRLGIFTTRQYRQRRFQTVRPPRSLVRSSVQTDRVTTISHERLEQSRWNLEGIFNSPYRWRDIFW